MPSVKPIILAGAGVVHAGVLRLQAQHHGIAGPISVVSASAQTPYSGMLPGWIAGHYHADEINLNFARLSQAAGARLIVGQIDDLVLPAQQLSLEGGQRLGFGLLSLNVGAVQSPPSATNLLALRPFTRLLTRLDQWLVWARHQPERPLSVIVVGAGGAGFEVALALRYRLRQLQPQRALQLRLLASSDQALDAQCLGAQRLAARALHEHGIELLTQIRVQAMDGQVIRASQRGQDLRLSADLIIWAGGAQAAPWLASSGLACDALGFVQVNADLRSRSHANILASGDCASFSVPVPKAGVYAVRQAAVLYQNLVALSRGQTELKNYQPARRALSLFATGPQSAIASWGPLSVAGRWVWRWKNQIDRNFLLKHRP